MNCSQCSTPVDYRFSTTCLLCRAELPVPEPARDQEGSLVPDAKGPIALQPPRQRKMTLGKRVANASLVLMCSFASMILGASATFFIGWIIYQMISTPGPHSCGQGTAIAYLLILTGGFLGCTSGAVFGYRNTMSHNPRLS
jgi:hypothetical protein